MHIKSGSEVCRLEHIYDSCTTLSFCDRVCMYTYLVDTLDLCSDLKNAVAACCVAAALTTRSATNCFYKA